MGFARAINLSRVARIIQYVATEIHDEIGLMPVEVDARSMPRLPYCTAYHTGAGTALAYTGTVYHAFWHTATLYRGYSMSIRYRFIQCGTVISVTAPGCTHGTCEAGVLHTRGSLEFKLDSTHRILHDYRLTPSSAFRCSGFRYRGGGKDDSCFTVQLTGLTDNGGTTLSDRQVTVPCHTNDEDASCCVEDWAKPGFGNLPWNFFFQPAELLM